MWPLWRALTQPGRFCHVCEVFLHLRLPVMLRLSLCFFCVESCVASHFEVWRCVNNWLQLPQLFGFECKGLSKVPLVSGLVQKLQAAFPGEPALAVEKAVADGLVRSLGDERIDLHEVMCIRDYSRLCPEGKGVFACAAQFSLHIAFVGQGWADVGDGSACVAPKSYQGACMVTASMLSLHVLALSRWRRMRAED